MENLRKLLSWCSGLAAVIIFFGWLLFNRTFDILPFGFILLLSLNAFYIYFSRPKVQTSDILEQAASKLTLASLEFNYMSQEAKAREIELENLRQAQAEEEKYKLQVARDMLEHLQKKLPTRKIPLPLAQRIAHRPHIGNEILAQFAGKAKAAPVDVSGSVDPAAAKQVQAGLLTASPPGTSALN